MSSEMVRWGGLAGLAAGLMYLLSGILTLIAAPQITDNSRFLKLLPDRDRPSRSLRVNACHHSGSARPSARALRATRDGGLLANLRRLRPRVGERTPHHSGGGRTRLLRSPHGRVGNGRRFDTPGSHDALRAGAAVVGRGAAHSLIPPRRYPGLGRSKREHRVRGGMGVARLRAL